MTYSAEFIVRTGDFEHVKFTVDGEDFWQTFDKGEDLGPQLGDYHASLRAAVLYGRDNAIKEVAEATKASGVMTPKAIEASPVDLIESELGATVIEEIVHEARESFEDTMQKAVQAASEGSKKRPWDVASAVPQKSAQTGLEDF